MGCQQGSALIGFRDAVSPFSKPFRPRTAAEFHFPMGKTAGQGNGLPCLEQGRDQAGSIRLRPHTIVEKNGGRRLDLCQCEEPGEEALIALASLLV